MAAGFRGEGAKGKRRSCTEDYKRIAGKAPK
jgi:hypothetical protein